MNIYIQALLRAAIPCAAFLIANHANAATLSVTNDGVDSATCGSSAAPCRSISQGIENALDGDTIEVGAGLYGDISGNNDFSGPGDEHPQMTGPDNRLGCIVCITKAVHIFSLHGAAVTVIAGIPSTPFTANVMILHDGVLFGRAGGGFTLTGGNVNGLLFDQNKAGTDFGLSLTHSITVAGNIDLGDQNGFVVNGLEFMDDPCPEPSCQPTAQITLSDNEAINNAGSGFSVTVNAYHGGPITLQGNLASGAGTGFSVAAGFQDESGGAFSAGIVLILENVAVHNGLGFSAGSAGTTVGNTAVNNSQAGFLVVPNNSLFQNNSAIGNAGPGAIVQFSTDGLDTQGLSQFRSFTQNNFYGNDRNRPVLSLMAANFSNGFAGYNPGPSAHCGVLNLGALAATVGPQSGGTPPTIHLAATGNFWGSTAGPMPRGGGDAAGGACDQNGGVTLAKPFAATAPFGITSSSWP
jgi:hypothetical protein